MNWVKRNWYVVVFVVVNLAVAAPAGAGVKNGICDDGQGGSNDCCVGCWFFCGCDYIE